MCFYLQNIKETGIIYMYILMKNGGTLMQNAAAIVYTSSSEFMHNNRVGALREVVFRPIIEWVNEALDSAGISDR